ncbi:MAG: hypothetical protein EOM28_09970 [Clostridia bacterium]|nr:hypothetical protein [Clostridia bacterium]
MEDLSKSFPSKKAFLPKNNSPPNRKWGSMILGKKGFQKNKNTSIKGLHIRHLQAPLPIPAH